MTKRVTDESMTAWGLGPKYFFLQVLSGEFSGMVIFLSVFEIDVLFVLVIVLVWYSSVSG